MSSSEKRPWPSWTDVRLPERMAAKPSSGEECITGLEGRFCSAARRCQSQTWMRVVDEAQCVYSTAQPEKSSVVRRGCNKDKDKNNVLEYVYSITAALRQPP